MSDGPRNPLHGKLQSFGIFVRGSRRGFLAFLISMPHMRTLEHLLRHI